MRVHINMLRFMRFKVLTALSPLIHDPKEQNQSHAEELTTYKWALKRADFARPTFRSSDACLESRRRSGSVSVPLVPIGPFLQTFLPAILHICIVYVCVFMVPPSSSLLLQTWIWRQRASPKRCLVPTSPHGDLTENNIVRAVDVHQMAIVPVTLWLQWFLHSTVCLALLWW